MFPYTLKNLIALLKKIHKKYTIHYIQAEFLIDESVKPPSVIDQFTDCPFPMDKPKIFLKPVFMMGNHCDNTGIRNIKLKY